MLPEKYTLCFYSSCSSRKDVLALFCCFQDCYCYSNSDVIRHVTKYCSVIGPHCTVRRDTACICSSPDPSLFCGSELGLRDYDFVRWPVLFRMTMVHVHVRGLSSTHWLACRLFGTGTITFWKKHISIEIFTIQIFTTWCGVFVYVCKCV